VCALGRDVEVFGEQDVERRVFLGEDREPSRVVHPDPG